MLEAMRMRMRVQLANQIAEGVWPAHTNILLTPDVVHEALEARSDAVSASAAGT